MRCKTCHYSLANLTEHRCPECGTPFDPNDPSTYFEPPIVVTLPMMLRIAIVCYVLNLLAVIYVAINELPNNFGALLATPLTAALLLVGTFPIGMMLYGIFWIIRKSFRSPE